MTCLLPCGWSPAGRQQDLLPKMNPARERQVPGGRGRGSQIQPRLRHPEPLLGHGLLRLHNTCLGRQGWMEPLGLTQIPSPLRQGDLTRQQGWGFEPGLRLRVFFLVLRRMAWLIVRPQMGNLLETWAFRTQASREWGWG